MERAREQEAEPPALPGPRRTELYRQALHAATADAAAGQAAAAP